MSTTCICVNESAQRMAQQKAIIILVQAYHLYVLLPEPRLHKRKHDQEPLPKVPKHLKPGHI